MNMEHSDLDFTCPYGNEKLKRVQRELLELFKEIDALFKKNNIHYFLIYGTLLGAVRHQGFIPWDDDLDIAVFKEDYDRAMELLRKSLSDKYIVHDKLTDPVYWCDFSKIRYRNSTATNEIWLNDNKYKYKGVCLDIYRCWETPCSKYRKKQNRSKEHAKFALMNLSASKNLTSKTKALFKCFTPLFSYFYYYFLDIVSKKEMRYICDPADFSVPIKKEHLMPLREGLFEGISVPVPCDAEAVLTDRYGDFMKLPPKEQRLPHYSTVEFYDE